MMENMISVVVITYNQEGTISRTLDSSFLKGSFLAVGEDEIYLATYYVAAMAAVILFVVMLFFAVRSEMDGGLTIRFLLLFGAVSIITESLRYDFFLSVSFVGLQQVAAALMLALGVILAIRRSNRPKSALAAVAIASIPLMVGAVDPDDPEKGLEAFRKALKDAGIDRIIEEAQTQYTTWKESLK